MNNMKKIERNSNHELMRIISMFLIVLGHSILFGNALKNSQNESVTMILMIWEFILLVHVNSFALLTGYYQSNSTFKQSALWKIINLHTVNPNKPKQIKELHGTKERKNEKKS